MAAQGAAPRWWRRGRDIALANARAAAGAAAAAFIELDAAQQRLGLRVEAYAALERGRTADDLRRLWAATRVDVDAAVTGYLDLAGRHDTGTDLTEDDATAATAAFHHAEAALRRALSAVTAFDDRSGRDFARAEESLGRLEAAARSAGEAIAAAQAAIGRAATPPHDAVEALGRAEAARRILAEGPAAHGLQASLRAADGVRTESARAIELSDTLPERLADLRRSTASARTRLEAIVTQRDKLSDTLSTLRRGFVGRSYADVEPKPAEADRHLDAARRSLALVDRHAAVANLPRARSALGSARGSLDAAAAAVAAVTDRLATLESLRADPGTVIQKTRFVLREAQRLFVFLGERADQRFATQLDAMARRIADAERAFADPHPDYWRLDQDLARIRAETTDVVERLRAG